MERNSLIRLGGLSAMVGGVAYTALGLLVPFLEPMFFVLLALGAMVAIAALHVLQRERYGLPGALASLTVFIGVVLILSSNLGFTEGLPWPLPERIFMVGAVVAALGMVALGIATLAARVLPWWCGVALMVGGVGFLGPVFALSLVGFSIGLLAGVAWALVGFALLRARVFLAGSPVWDSPVRMAAVIGAMVGTSLGVSFWDWKRVVALTVAGAVGFGLGGAIGGDSPSGLLATGVIGGALLGAALGHLENRSLAEERRPRVR